MHGRGCVSIKLYLQKQAVGHTWPVVHRGQTCYGEKQSCRRKAIRLFHGTCGSRLSAGVLCHFSSLSLLSLSVCSVKAGSGGHLSSRASGEALLWLVNATTPDGLYEEEHPSRVRSL